MARLSAVLPDPAVGLGPPFDRALHLALKVLPRHAGEELARARVEVYRVQQRAPDVVLLLVVGVVADPHGARVLVAREVVEGGFAEVDAVIDRVQHLERRAVADLIGDEVEEAVRLVVEAERVQPPQRERRVAHPAVPVVPVPFPARCLGERRRGCRQQRAGGRVRQALQRERAALKDAAPRMIGERSVVQPSAPEVRGPAHARGRVLVRQRRVVVRPRQRDEVAIALLHLVERQRRTSFEPQAHAGRQSEGGVVLASAGDGLAVAGARVLPCRVGPAVVEHGLAVHLDVDAAVDAAELAHQHVFGHDVGRRTAIGPMPLVVAPRPDDQRVAHHEPAGARVPRRLQDVRPRDVAAPRRREQLGRSQPERAGAPIEDRAEHARGVRPRHAQPLDVAARGDERRDLSVGDEPVVRDRRERAGAAGTPAWTRRRAPAGSRGRCPRRESIDGRDSVASIRAWRSMLDAFVASGGSRRRILLDVDGTLSPIVERPELARLVTGTDAVLVAARRALPRRRGDLRPDAKISSNDSSTSKGFA